MITAFAPPTFDAKALAERLRADGVQVDCRPIAGRLESHLETTVAVVVYPAQGVVSIGDVSNRVRNALGPRPTLIVCAPQLTAAERRTVQDESASIVVSPADWTPGRIGERLLGELVQMGLTGENRCGLLRGGTHAMQGVYRDIETFAPHKDPVLILGETGTGKELVARELYTRSGGEGPFVGINCAALPPELLESELFGHSRGAFTTAIADRIGLLEYAKEGTVFLDEIGELPLASQVKLLRVIEERTVRPIGTNRTVDIRSRLILATNRELEDEVTAGTFREDLLARLSGLIIRLPPLRERLGDLRLLGQHFIDEYNKEKKLSLRLEPPVVDTLYRYEWPRNVRELRLTMRRACICTRSSDGAISGVVLNETVRRRSTVPASDFISFDPMRDSFRDVVRRVTQVYIAAVLRIEGGNVSAAARRAKMSRSRFNELLGSKLERHSSRPEPEDPLGPFAAE